MDIAILADAHTSKTGTGVASHFYQNRNGNGSSSSNRHATTGPSDMDLSAINHDEIKVPTFHEEESSSSSPGQTDMIREFNRMKSELKKFQTEAAISALGSSSSSSSSSRVQVSKEEFEYCFKNRLCLKCKKPNHMAKDCRSKYQPLNM